MKNIFKIKNVLKIFLLLIFWLVFLTRSAKALDSDADGIKDFDEINVYFTNPFNKDTDGDGYSDWLELNNGWSPYTKEKKKLTENDADQDGLTDRFELSYNLNPLSNDTDQDGYKDKEELLAGFDPKNKNPEAKLEKKIEIDLKNQLLKQIVGPYKINEFLISSGNRKMPTPKGEFKVLNKHPRPWSKYGLWMPWWVGLDNGKFGIHELPEWPNGYKEGVNHLGMPVSHGCIRLGVGPAKIIYDWAEIGMKVKIY